MWVGSGNINPCSRLLVHKSDTLSLPSQTVRYTQLWEIEECEWYFCNRCWSLLFTITLSLTASAGPCLVNQLLRTLRKMTLFLNLGWSTYRFSSERTQPGFSPPGTVFTLPFIVVWWDRNTSNWIPPYCQTHFNLCCPWSGRLCDISYTAPLCRVVWEYKGFCQTSCIGSKGVVSGS